MGAPPQAGIQGLHPALFNSFKGGRVTNMNLTDMTPEMSLIASNVCFLGDRAVTKRPGYTLVRNYGANPVLSMHDFQRASDDKQFLIVQQPGTLSAGDVQGLNAPQVLSDTEDPSAQYSFTDTDWACYCSNGKKSLRLVDNQGTLTAYNFGLPTPPTAPTIGLLTVGHPTISLVYGRQYVFSYVSKITDSLGNTHISVGAPSPISANTGAFTNKYVVIETTTPITDPQITHIWVFATYDSPANSTSTYNFLTEIPVTGLGPGPWTATDSSADTALNANIPAPFENYPAPLAQKLLQYQSRIVALGIAGAPNWVQLSGYSEILTGVSQEAWPADLIFEVPSGKQSISGGEVLGHGNNARLMIANANNWFQLRGSDPTTFQLTDKMMQPGCAGFKLSLVTDHFLIWLSPDKKLYAWDGTYPAIPIEISKNIAKTVTGIGLSMEDLSTAQLSNCELRWFQWGRYSWVVLVAATGTAGAGAHDWIQIWDTSFLGDTLSDNKVALLAESDMFPTDQMTTSAIVQVEDENFIFFGDGAGNVYRFPDGYDDNGKEFQPTWGTVWSGLSGFIGPMFHPLPVTEVVKQLFFADIQTDRQDAPTAFTLLGVALPSPDNSVGLVDCELEPFLVPYASAPTSARAFLNRPGTAIGRWARFIVVFPIDSNPATLWSLTVSARPVYGLAP